MYPQICCLILSRWESCSAWPVTAWIRGSRSRGTESKESWKPPLVKLEGWGAAVGRWDGGVGVKSAQREEASAVRRIGSVEGLQVEKTWASSVLMVRVCEQSGGRER